MTPAGMGAIQWSKVRRAQRSRKVSAFVFFFFLFSRTTISSSTVDCFNCDGEKVLNYVNNDTEKKKTPGTQVLTEVVKSWPRGICDFVYFVTVAAGRTKLSLRIPSYFRKRLFFRTLRSLDNKLWVRVRCQVLIEWQRILYFHSFARKQKNSGLSIYWIYFCPSPQRARAQCCRTRRLISQPITRNKIYSARNRRHVCIELRTMRNTYGSQLYLKNIYYNKKSGQRGDDWSHPYDEYRVFIFHQSNENRFKNIIIISR